MAYCTVDDVTLLVPSLSGTDAEDAAAALVEAASDFVDGYTGRSWVAGTVTGEVQTVRSGRITLDRAPISGITVLSVIAPYIGAAAQVMVAGTGYQILDVTQGLVLVAASDDSRATVTYTAAPGTVPDDIKQATAMLAAHWAGSAVDNSGAIFSKIKAGSAELTYRETALSLPANVEAILDGYRPAVVMA